MGVLCDLLSLLMDNLFQLVAQFECELVAPRGAALCMFDQWLSPGGRLLDFSQHGGRDLTVYDCGKIPTARGSRQVVRRQPSKLISAGSNRGSRSLSVTSNQLPVKQYWLTDHWLLLTEKGPWR